MNFSRPCWTMLDKEQRKLCYKRKKASKKLNNKKKNLSKKVKNSEIRNRLYEKKKQKNLLITLNY